MSWEKGMADEIEDIKEENNLLREALEKVEWVGDTGGEVVLDYYCEVCNSWKGDGHLPTCLIKLALKG